MKRPPVQSAQPAPLAQPVPNASEERSPANWTASDPCVRERRRFKMTPSEWAFARERFRIAPDELPPNAANTAPGMADLMAQALKSLNLPTVQRVAALAPHWGSIVGEELAKHSRPARVTAKTLFVAVDHPMFLARFRGPSVRRLLDYVQSIAPDLGVTLVRAFVEAAQ